MPEARILVVDDEPKLVRLVREVLTATGFEVMSTSSGENAVEMAALERPDLIVLDIVLSGAMDGYEVARRVREFSDVPIIMLTAKAREADLLRGFDAGADDYLTKPFSSKELLARVRAVLKRAGREPAAPVESEIVCGELKIDLARRHVTVAGQQVQLTPTEYNVLHELASHRNQCSCTNNFSPPSGARNIGTTSTISALTFATCAKSSNPTRLIPSSSSRV